MKSTQWNARFWASTRGRIILLLRRESRTVNELAEALRLTDNAVRTHLTTLDVSFGWKAHHSFGEPRSLAWSAFSSPRTPFTLC